MGIKRIALGALLFLVVYNLLFFHTQPGIGIGLFFLFLTCYFYFLKTPDNKNILLALTASFISILFAFLFAYRGNEIVQLINISAAVFFTFISLYLYKQPNKLLPEIGTLALSPLVFIKDLFITLMSFTRLERRSIKIDKGSTQIALLRGIVITIPVFLILFFLLVQADPIFAKITQDFFNNLGERTIVSLILFAVLMVLGITKIADRVVAQVKTKTIALGKAHELGIITGSIIVLFAVFIGIQFRYLFSNVGERELHQLGINSLTYSEYVRKGFFELLIASALASSVIVYVLRYLHALEDRQKLIIQFISSILTIETGLLLLSAGKRVELYAGAHGLTRARIFGFIFLLWLAAFLIFYFIRILKEIKQTKFFVMSLTATAGALLLINVINIDSVIATKYRPTVNNEIDYYYLSSLSTDAYESWKPAITDAENTLNRLASTKTISSNEYREFFYRQATINALIYKINYLFYKYGTEEEVQSWNNRFHNSYSADYKKENYQWQAFNFSEYRAYKDVSGNKFYLNKMPILKDKAESIEKRINNDIRYNTPLDRSSEPPLVL